MKRSTSEVNKPDTSQGHNLRRLFVLRNLTIVWEVITVVLVHTGLEISLPLLPLSIIVTTHAGINVLTWLRLRGKIRVSDFELLIQLVIDVAVFTVVLYLTGGATNPFAWFYLLPVIIAATVLPPQHTWSMAVITTLSYTFLLNFYLPLPGMDTMHHEGFGLHVFGMWFGFVLSAGLIAHFVTDMAHTLRERDRKLAEIREQALRDERLIALGTLAAGAAHELGTPLATMAIISNEIQQDYPLAQYQDLNERLVILDEQLARCKDALSVISASAGEIRAESGRPMTVDQYLQEILAQWRGQRPDTDLQYHQRVHHPNSQIIAERTLSQALINILNNAADASPEHIEMQAEWNRDELTLEISDRGEGFDQYSEAIAGKLPYSTKEQGLGIGLFLAQATIKRMGGQISLFNRTREGGACTRIRLPLLIPTRDRSEAQYGENE